MPFLNLPITNPTIIFFVVLLIILLSPIVMGRLRIPHIIGLVLAGVAIGPYGLNILARDTSFELFGKVGLYYIMFLAAIEMDMNGLRSNLRRMLVFGALTFAIPFVLTLVLGRTLLNYSHIASLLLACVMSSNTLISYPIVTRFGLQRKPSVVLSIGSSMLSLMLTLIILASVVATASGEGGGTLFWLWFATKIALFMGGSIFLIPRVTRWFIRFYSDAVMQFIFVLAMLFMSAALAELIGLEGILGAFFCGLILNRYIPRTSPLMNRLEFTGNAIFIPYFLIGVGMLINVHLLFLGGNILWVVFWIVLVGTLGKALAAYAACFMFKMPTASGNMMFGLTSAHAAGAIAIVMVGMRLTDSNGASLVSDEMLNGVVIMILVTCIISTMITQRAAEQIVVSDEDSVTENARLEDEEKILVPIKYPEYANRLVSLATMVRNPKSKTPLVGINVVYDDTHVARNQQRGQQLLDKVSTFAAASDVAMECQVRIAANIANGIKHAFAESHSTEIIIGLHMHFESNASFWGDFHQSLFNGLNNQIIMARLYQPLATLRRISVAVPSRAQFEPGFYRWIERIARLAENIECRVDFHGRGDTLQLIERYMLNKHRAVRTNYGEMTHWNELPALLGAIGEDHLLVIVTARKGTISHKTAQEKLPEEVERSFSGNNLLIIFPDQHGDAPDELTFAQAQHTEQKSIYDSCKDLIKRLRKSLKR